MGSVALHSEGIDLSFLSDSPERLPKRARLDSTSKGPVALLKGKARTRYRPQRSTPACSVLEPLSGFDYRQLLLEHQNDLRSKVSKHPPDPGKPSSFCQQAVAAVGQSIPPRPALEEVHEMEERLLVKLHRHLGVLASKGALPCFTTSISLPTTQKTQKESMLDDPAVAFELVLHALAEYNTQVGVFAAIARRVLTQRDREKQNVQTLQVAPRMDRQEASNESQSSTARTRSTNVTIPSPGEPSFDALLQVLATDDPHCTGLGIGHVELLLQGGIGSTEMLRKQTGTSSFDVYLRLAQQAGYVQIEEGCVRLMPAYLEDAAQAAHEKERALREIVDSMPPRSLTSIELRKHFESTINLKALLSKVRCTSFEDFLSQAVASRHIRQEMTADMQLCYSPLSCAPLKSADALSSLSAFVPPTGLDARAEAVNYRAFVRSVPAKGT